MHGKAYGTGKRKNAIARVLVKPGSGIITVNGRALETYFPRPTSVMVVKQALEAVEKQDQFDVTVNVVGGGESGQAGAVRHGISRALLVVDPTLRPVLKKAGFLTRDARKKERKKPGQPGARKRFQYSKR
ncbi:MAG TPA: 30S ribosomal protein S9 [Polyangiales bacterium]